MLRILPSLFVCAGCVFLNGVGRTREIWEPAPDGIRFFSYEHGWPLAFMHRGVWTSLPSERYCNAWMSFPVEDDIAWLSVPACMFDCAVVLVAASAVLVASAKLRPNAQSTPA